MPTNPIIDFFCKIFGDPKVAAPTTSAPSTSSSKPLFTFDQFQKIFPSSPAANLRIYYDGIIDALPKADITTRERICCFLGQIGHESGEFMKPVTEENLYYTTASRLLAVFGSSKFEGKNVNDYLRNPERLANLVYANKGGNGNTASGDGWKYRGRGIIQLTLKDNYAACSRDMGVDLVNNPDLALEPKYAVLTATWYWKNRNLNYYADNGDFDTLTYRINTAKANIEHRKELYQRAKAVII